MLVLWLHVGPLKFYKLEYIYFPTKEMSFAEGDSSGCVEGLQ
jgi:hypothetical protein